MKEIFIGTAKACFYIGALIGMYLALTGFNKPSQVDIAGLLAMGAIVKHFVDKEQLKK